MDEFASCKRTKEEVADYYGLKCTFHLFYGKENIRPLKSRGNDFNL